MYLYTNKKQQQNSTTMKNTTTTSTTILTLSTREGRMAANQGFCEEAQKQIEALGFTGCAIEMYKNRIEIGYGVENRIVFGTKITVYAADEMFGQRREARINFASSSTFTPYAEGEEFETRRMEYIANALRVWGKLAQKVNQLCEAYTALHEKMSQAAAEQSK